jgi:hypothetical protein
LTRKAFGDGKCRFRFTLADGRTGFVKAPYIGEWNEDDVKHYLSEQILVEHGSKVVKMELVGVTEG